MIMTWLTVYCTGAEVYVWMLEKG